MDGVVLKMNITITVNTNYFIDITLHPQSVNTTLNSTVNFTCETAAAVDIIFRVNDESTSDADIINKGFIVQRQNTLSDGIKRRVLLANALFDNNNTNIVCKAINSTSNNTAYSDIAVLRIQGELML